MAQCFEERNWIRRKPKAPTEDLKTYISFSLRNYGMPFRITVSEPSERKAYQFEREAPTLVGMKIGQSFDGSVVGLTGYTLEITGGSDKDGFPMRKDLEGPGRRRLVLGKGTVYRPEEK